MPLIDLTNKVFGRLQVLAMAPKTRSRTAWVCICVCGEKRVVIGQNLTRGKTLSCGCLNKENVQARVNSARHLEKEYSVWSNMMARCYKDSDKSYQSYGGRGIDVCKRWHVFLNFVADMGRIPSGMTLERTNVNAGYSPENCVWATQAEQCRNKRNNVWYTVNGERKTQADWAASLSTRPAVIRHRLRLGWSIEAACLTPVSRSNRYHEARIKRLTAIVQKDPA